MMHVPDKMWNRYKKGKGWTGHEWQGKVYS